MRSRRLRRSSCASIDSEASIASTTSIPSVRTMFVPDPHLGPAYASAASPIAAETRTARATGARRTPTGASRSIAASTPSCESRATRRRCQSRNVSADRNESTAAATAAHGRSKRKFMDSSRQGPPQGKQRELEQQRDECDAERQPIEFTIPDVALRVNRRTLERVDLRVDALERLSVLRPEVPAARGLRDELEQRFVELDRPRFVSQTEHAAPHGPGRPSLGADADG